MRSTITNTGYLLIISTPKSKSGLLIVLFSILILHNSYGIIGSFFLGRPLILFEKIFIFTFCPVVILLALKGLLWQLKGVKIMEIGAQKIVFKKVAPLKYRKREYDIKAIKSVAIGNEAVSMGPLAMLQQLGIIDKISIDLTYGYDTVKTLGGFDFIEAVEIEQIIKRKIGLE